MISFLKNRFVNLTPFQVIFLGFVIIVGIGALLLQFPFSSQQHHHEPWIDAFFTATSAVTTTGLIIVDTGSYYSLTGQLIILSLIQIGGLGYMILITLFTYLIRKEPSLNIKSLLRESLAGTTLGGIKRFVGSTILFTILFELGSAVLLSLFYLKQYTAVHAFYLGLFHSISAFCTAGFSLFPNSFEVYKDNISLNILLDIICITGGIGFFVIQDFNLYFLKKLKHNVHAKLSMHSKLVSIITLFLITFGCFILFFDTNLSAIIPLKEKILAISFQTISATSTTGFNTVEIGGLGQDALFIIIILMFIGASPGGTGGGIKTTSLGAMVFHLIGLLKGQVNTNAFKKEIPREAIDKSFAIAILAFLLITGVSLTLILTERISFLKILFETVSAFGTVGLSTGITSQLSFVGKILIIITMFVGRIGVLTLGYSLLGRPKPADFRYPAGILYIG